MAAKGGQDAVARAERLLDRVGLSQRAGHLPGQLSGGERQRAAVVRALINRPRLLLADEPTGSLNESGAEELARLLLELNREEEMTLIVVTHAEAIAQRMDRILDLREGKAVERVLRHA
jgi:lipoprotein-releasing system ATP-binding protein